MNEVYIFDIDGTLTPPRQPMSCALADALVALGRLRHVYLASGSDYPKIVEQVPEKVVGCIDGIFPCAGAEFWQGSLCAYAEDHHFPPGLVMLFQSLMTASPYPHRFGAHIEKRTGMLNVSVAGRFADRQQRADYRHWDDQHNERAAIAEAMARAYPDYEYAIGGDISIDIFPKGANKSRILQTLDRLHPNAAYRFFGDRTAAGGNDWPLAQALSRRGPRHHVHSVTDCEETREIIEAIIARDRYMRVLASANSPALGARSHLKQAIREARRDPSLSSQKNMPPVLIEVADDEAAGENDLGRC